MEALGEESASKFFEAVSQVQFSYVVVELTEALASFLMVNWDWFLVPRGYL